MVSSCRVQIEGDEAAKPTKQATSRVEFVLAKVKARKHSRLAGWRGEAKAKVKAGYLWHPTTTVEK